LAFLVTLVAKAFFPYQPVKSIRKELAKDLETFTIKSVALALHERYGLGPDETVTIFIDFDEFQSRVTAEDMDVIANRRDKSGIHIRRMALAIMSVCSQFAPAGVHVVPIFSGTLSVEYIGLFRGSFYKRVNIPMGPLRRESSIEAVRQVLKDRPGHVPTSLIGAMGGIGRGLEFLSEEL